MLHNKSKIVVVLIRTRHIKTQISAPVNGLHYMRAALGYKLSSHNFNVIMVKKRTLEEVYQNLLLDKLVHLNELLRAHINCYSEEK